MTLEYKDIQTPCKMSQFEKNGYRVLDFAAGQNFVILKVKTKQGSLNMLGMVHPDYYYYADRYFGENKTKLLEKTLWRLDSISAE